MTSETGGGAMPDEHIEELARQLMQARTTRQAVALPAGFAAHCDQTTATRIAARHQQLVLGRHGGRVIGCKLGGTNREALARLGLARPFVGPIFSAFTHASGVTLPRAEFLRCVIEAEVAVRLGRPLDARAGPIDRPTLLDAIEALFPVIEIADSRLAGFPALPPAAITADLGFGAALVMGAPCADWRGQDLASASVRLLVNGEAVRDGSGAAVLGDPLNALAEFAAQAAAEGRMVPAGELVSTGTWTAPYMAQAQEHIVADFGSLGRVELRLG